MKIICCTLLLFLGLITAPRLQAQSIHAVGRIESFAFEFNSKSAQELNRDCIAFATEQRIAHIDDIYVSFNGHKRLHLHHFDGVWHYPKHFCAELEKVANSIDLTPPSSNELQELEAIISLKNYRFNGSNEAEIFNNCILQLENHGQRETDYIRVRLLDRPEQWKILRNNDGWWRGAQQVCTLIDQAIFNPRRIGRAPAVLEFY